MKTYDEYMENIRKKAKKIKIRRKIFAGSMASVLVLSVALTLFLPFGNQPPSVKKYKNSPYYALIDRINRRNYRPSSYKNNYERWKAELFRKVTNVDDGEMGELYYAPGTAAGEQTYQEVTDNQVDGVIEGDLFKRSDRYLYYLRQDALDIYSIDRENSQRLSTVDIASLLKSGQTEQTWITNGDQQIYLSADCQTVTVLLEVYGKAAGLVTVLISLDVSDPMNVQCMHTQYFKGSYVSSRMVDGQILLTYDYGFFWDQVNFADPNTFVPTYGSDLEEMQPISSADIYCPEDPNANRYTVIAKLDQKTLEVEDTVALLSYAQELYVSEDMIFATYQTVRKTQLSDTSYATDMVTTITGIDYTGESLAIKGTVEVDGSMKDQYSMDAHEGILRIVTSTVKRKYDEKSTYYNKFGAYTQTNSLLGVERNCNLYCVDLGSWEVAASVIGFAPAGEEVTSARFDGTSAYVCTAEVVALTDPVYFFDLSDIHHITYRQTPDIDGYSSSLIQFGDYLLGVGINEARQMKLEVYRQGENSVDPVASYEREAVASDEYKAYFIDRENDLIGLPVKNQNGQFYLLLHFEGRQFRQLQQLEVQNVDLDDVRSDIIDGYLYLLGHDLQVVKLG